jgi:hypothetical protein
MSLFRYLLQWYSIFDPSIAGKIGCRGGFNDEYAVSGGNTRYFIRLCRASVFFAEGVKVVDQSLSLGVKSSRSRLDS